MRQEPRKRGRPPIDDDDSSTVLYVKIPSKLYDAAYRQAERDRMSMPDMVRQAVRRAVQADRDE